MFRIRTALAAVALVYGLAQLTIDTLMTARVEAFAADLAASPTQADGTLGPIAVRNPDICTLLTETASWKGTLARCAFIAPGRAADALTARYRFVAIGGCSKHRTNLITAQPRGS